MSPRSVELTKAEWPVIQAVWELEPCTAPAVREKLAKATGWTYSTVRTLMNRLAAKGVLTARKEGKLAIYNSAINNRKANDEFWSAVGRPQTGRERISQSYKRLPPRQNRLICLCLEDFRFMSGDAF